MKLTALLHPRLADIRVSIKQTVSQYCCTVASPFFTFTVSHVFRCQSYLAQSCGTGVPNKYPLTRIGLTLTASGNCSNFISGGCGVGVEGGGDGGGGGVRGRHVKNLQSHFKDISGLSLRAVVAIQSCAGRP